MRQGYLVVRVEGFHVREVRVSDSDDDDAEGQFAAFDDGVLGRLHVVDAAVCEDEQHRVGVGVRLSLLVRAWGFRCS